MALRIDLVSLGELVLLISNPRRVLALTTSESSSAPACVAQKKHSSSLALRRRLSWLMTKPSQEAPILGWPSRSCKR